MARRGLTLIELIVSLGICALLVSLLIPAVGAARGASRKMECSSHLKQLGLAVTAYEAQFGVFPMGAIHKYQLLPLLDQGALYRRYDGKAPFVPDRWKPIEDAVIPIYLCVSDPAPASQTSARYGTTNYAACSGTGIQRYGYDGFFNLGFTTSNYPGGPVRAADIKDGLSNTVAMSEMLRGDGSKDRLRTVWRTPTPMTTANELDAFAQFCEMIPPDPVSFGYNGDAYRRGVPWWNGDSGCGMYNHILPPNRPSCSNGGLTQYGAYSATSFHSNGVNALFGDGRVTFINDSVDRHVWREFGSRAKMQAPSF